MDDEPQVLVALQDLLEDEFQVTATNEPERALRIVEEDHDLAVVISDQRMPGMSGTELLSKVREHSSAARILCTGYADLQAVVSAVNEGNIFAYVTKPWDGVDLRLKIHHAADHFRLNHALSYEKQLLDDLLSSIPDSIFFKDTQHRYLRVNNAFLRALAATEEQVIGKRLADIWPDPELALAVEAIERQILEGGPPHRDERQFRGRDGSQHASSTTWAGIRSPQGDVLGLVGISQDITERLRAIEALRVSEERLRLAFQASNTGLFDWNLQTGETMYSPNLATFESRGAPVEDFAALEARVHPADRGAR